MTYKRGDVVYGYAHYHKKWDYCLVESVFPREQILFGHSVSGHEFYKMKFENLIPEYVAKSPLWKALE